ncbi:porin [Caminibacter mediatlanticus]|uniref:Porin n=1 Tax=Caminibacter mediatlanticus TB-2 TaxID=391592 RepID=A0AAI9AGL9_9BACT|nr:porin [Caminibacter mediatlanticus]EDM23303.1 hypothetical protein CMTB2_06381 [Caminibacter mediatlanticus TB-2]
MLKKLSLAAIIAVSGVSFASATPLTDAIKNVDVSGKLDIEYTGTKRTSYTSEWTIDTEAKFTVPISEELKFIFNAKAKGVDEKVNFNQTEGYVNYTSANGYFVNFGKFALKTPITDDAISQGVLAGTKVNNVTLVGAFLDKTYDTDKVTVDDKNIYAVGAIIPTEYVNFQAWYFNVNDTINSDVVLRADIKPIENILLHADYATADLNDRLNNSKTQTYYNVSAKVSYENYCAKVGYAATGKDGGIVTLEHDSPLTKVSPTENLQDIANSTDTTLTYAKIGAKIGAYTPYAGFAYRNDKVNKDKDTEYKVGVNYQYNKKTTISAYYNYFNNENAEQKYDVEFTYKF